MVFESLVRNKLIDEKTLSPCDTVPNKGNKMAMVDSADDLNLCLELPLPLPAPALELLHRHVLPVGENAPEDVSEPTLTDHVGLREATGGGCQLFIGERALVEPQREGG